MVSGDGFHRANLKAIGPCVQELEPKMRANLRVFCCDKDPDLALYYPHYLTNVMDVFSVVYHLRDWFEVKDQSSKNSGYPHFLSNSHIILYLYIICQVKPRIYIPTCKCHVNLMNIMLLVWGKFCLVVCNSHLLFSGMQYCKCSRIFYMQYWNILKTVIQYS